MKIHSDNQKAQQLLEKIAYDIKHEGGFIHAEIHMVCQSNSLSIHSELDANHNAEIINIPEQCLPSCLDFDIKHIKNSLTIVDRKPCVSASHEQFMQLMLELFNLLKGEEIAKIDTFKNELQEKNPKLFELIDPVQSLSKHAENNCHSFLQTRSINFTNHLNQVRHKVLMPIIDSINHNPNAHSFKSGVEFGSTGISIAHAKPIPGSSECFVSYGMLDPFNTAIGMNFFDAETSFVQSIPLTIAIDSKKSLNLYRNYHPADPAKIHPYLKDLGLYVPITSNPKESEIKLSHLFIPGRDKPRSLRRILEVLLLQSMNDPTAANKAIMESNIARMEELIITKNTMYFESIIDACKNVSGSSKIIADASKRSLAIINDYKNFRQQFPLTLINY